jgi:hypothetical protein
MAKVVIKHFNRHLWKKGGFLHFYLCADMLITPQPLQVLGSVCMVV